MVHVWMTQLELRSYLVMNISIAQAKVEFVIIYNLGDGHLQRRVDNSTFDKVRKTYIVLFCEHQKAVT